MNFSRKINLYFRSWGLGFEIRSKGSGVERRTFFFFPSRAVRILWCCGVLQCVACVEVCCSVLQGIEVCCRVFQWVALCSSVLQCVAVCCSVLQCVAVCCSVWQCVVVCGSVLQCVALRCNGLKCVAVCCSVLQSVQRVTVRRSAL